MPPARFRPDSRLANERGGIISCCPVTRCPPQPISPPTSRLPHTCVRTCSCCLMAGCSAKVNTVGVNGWVTACSPASWDVSEDDTGGGVGGVTHETAGKGSKLLRNRFAKPGFACPLYVCVGSLASSQSPKHARGVNWSREWFFVSLWTVIKMASWQSVILLSPYNSWERLQLPTGFHFEWDRINRHYSRITARSTFHVVSLHFQVVQFNPFVVSHDRDDSPGGKYWTKCTVYWRFAGGAGFQI